MSTPVQRSFREIIKAFMKADQQSLEKHWIELPETLRTPQYITRIADATQRVENARKRFCQEQLSVSGN